VRHHTEKWLSCVNLKVSVLICWCSRLSITIQCIRKYYTHLERNHVEVVKIPHKRLLEVLVQSEKKRGHIARAFVFEFITITTPNNKLKSLDPSLDT